MAKFINIGIFLISTTVAIPPPANREPVIDDDHRYCSSFCDGMFAKVANKSEDWSACHRGCQYFTIAQFLKGERFKDAIRMSCHAGMYFKPL